MPEPERDVPFPKDASPGNIICWVVNKQQREMTGLKKQLKFWQYGFIALFVVFVTYLVTGKLIFGVFGAP